MLYELYNRHNKCLLFDLDDMFIHVVSNQFLPYTLKDYIKDSDLSTKEAVKETHHHINVLRDWLSNRVLNLSRSNAKVILNITNLPQTIKTEDRLKIVIACRAMNMEDSFWLKLENEDLTFDNVHIRNHSLCEKSYDVAILGKHITATAKELRADLSSTGMFPKYWTRENGNVFLMKTDNLSGTAVEVELLTSKYLKDANVRSVLYLKEEKDGIAFTKSLCMADDIISLIHAQEVIDYYNHIGTDFTPNEDFANMVISDYVVANTDRHNENWGFLVMNTTNNIVDYAPLYDFNQCLVADQFGTDIDQLIYEPTGKTMIESVKQFVKMSTVNFNDVIMSDKCIERWDKVKSLKY